MEQVKPDYAAEIRQAGKQLRSAYRTVILLWLAPGLLLAPLAYLLLRYDWIIAPRALVELIGLLSYDLVLTAVLFIVGVWATSRMFETTSRKQVVWHAAGWSALLIAATPAVARHLAGLGWTGANWLYMFAGAALLGGLPLGYRWAVSWLGKVDSARDKQASLVAMRVDLQQRMADVAASVQLNRETQLASAAIARLRGRNHVTDQYAGAARVAMSRIQANGTFAEQAAAMQALKMRIEAGDPIA